MQDLCDSGKDISQVFMPHHQQRRVQKKVGEETVEGRQSGSVSHDQEAESYRQSHLGTSEEDLSVLLCHLHE